jgi:cytochrome c oxidase subunit 3
MSTTADPAPVDHAAHDHHSPHLAHHFDTPEQQFDSGVLGMWLFLATEILLFAGLFCAYAVYRGLHPEVFLKVDEYLDWQLGAINTCVLLLSSFTMAMGVWAAQQGKQKLLITMLALTLLGGFGFLGIKYVEYKAKWEHGVLWGVWFNPDKHGKGGHGAAHADDDHATAADAQQTAATYAGAPAGTAEDAAAAATPAAATQAAGEVEQWQYQPAQSGPRGLLRPPAGEADAHGEKVPFEDLIKAQFFGIYFAMTGLHGIHVIAGMAIIGWLLWRSAKGHFSKEYYTPVPLGGLYWHLVDLIWIYLFPLLYLIH